MRRLQKASAILGLCGALGIVDAGPAYAQTKKEKSDSKAVYTGKVALTGFYYTESDGIGHAEIDKDPTLIGQHIATTSRLGYGELRVMTDARRLANERIDFRLDVRLRATGNFNFEQKFNHDDYLPGDDRGNSLGTSSRGYLGGPEYDLREAYLNIRFTPRFGIQLGRMFVREADNIKVDGARLFRSFGTHWEGSAFIGGAPNPYSRSLLSDYVSPCGAGVAGERNDAANTPCVQDGPKLGLALGVGARYAYSTLWGNIGLIGQIYNGFGDGGPVSDGTNATLGPDTALDAPRIFFSWLNSWRPAERVDLLSDVVVDVYGSAGVQPTRALVLATFRLVKNDRLTLRLSYSHMSSLAINLYLNRLVYNRQSGTTLLAQGISAVENNLTILRTGRDEGRITLDSRFYRRLGAFIEGRLRSRFLINGESNPTVYGDRAVYGNNTQNLAYDVSGGLRDSGSLKGIRFGLTYSGIFDFRANNHVINFDIGRDFADDRFGFTISYVLALTSDKVPAGGSAGSCIATDPFSSCYGARSGATHEVGVQLTASPVRSLFFLLDYRFIALLTDPQNLSIGLTTYPPTLSHAILFRTEYRW